MASITPESCVYPMARRSILFLILLMLLVSTRAEVHASEHPFHAVQWSCDDLDNGLQPFAATVAIASIPASPATCGADVTALPVMVEPDRSFLPYLWRAPPAL